MEQQFQSFVSESATQPESTRANVPTDDDLFERYSLAISDLIEHAVVRGKHRIVVDALTWHLARFIAHHGAVAAGHILEKIGAYTTHINQRAQAQVEAEQAKQEGHKPN